MLPLISNSPEKLAHFLNTGLDLSEERERKGKEGKGRKMSFFEFLYFVFFFFLFNFIGF